MREGAYGDVTSTASLPEQVKLAGKSPGAVGDNSISSNWFATVKRQCSTIRKGAFIGNLSSSSSSLPRAYVLLDTK